MSTPELKELLETFNSKDVSDGETMCTGCWDKSGHALNFDCDIPEGETVWWEHLYSTDCDDWSAYCEKCAIEKATQRYDDEGFPIAPLLNQEARKEKTDV